jgi:hypothetical protein
MDEVDEMDDVDRSFLAYCESSFTPCGTRFGAT